MNDQKTKQQWTEAKDRAKTRLREILKKGSPVALASLDELANAQALRYHTGHETCGDRRCQICRQLDMGLDGSGPDTEAKTSSLAVFLCTLEEGRLVVWSGGTRIFIGIPDALGFKAAGETLAIELQIKASVAQACKCGDRMCIKRSLVGGCRGCTGPGHGPSCPEPGYQCRRCGFGAK